MRVGGRLLIIVIPRTTLHVCSSAINVFHMSIESLSVQHLGHITSLGLVPQPIGGRSHAAAEHPCAKVQDKKHHTPQPSTLLSTPASSL